MGQTTQLGSLTRSKRVVADWASKPVSTHQVDANPPKAVHYLLKGGALKLDLVLASQLPNARFVMDAWCAGSVKVIFYDWYWLYSARHDLHAAGPVDVASWLGP